VVGEPVVSEQAVTARVAMKAVATTSVRRIMG
jgi:hypothetical protein